MDNPNEKFFTITNNLFTFDSYACDCVIDIENIRPGEVKKTIKMQALPENRIRFAFAPDKGMVRLARNGTVNSDRILTELISLPEHDTEKLFAFFREYGFLFNLRTDEYEAIDIEQLFDLINRIRAVVQLLSELSETKKDYQAILGKVLYLQLKLPIELPLQCFGERSFRTCEYPLRTEIEKASRIPHIDGTREAFGSDTYAIPDTIYGPVYALNIETYNDIVNGYNTTLAGANQSPQFKDIVRLYRNALTLDSELRKIIDFLFHYQINIGVIKDFHASGEIEYYDTTENIQTNFTAHFDDHMKQAIIDIAKGTVRDEIEYNLYGVRPCYDITTMSPAWEIEDLLTGIYFSIFYMKPGVELYRKCANPNCDMWFLVKTTSSKRKYCTSYCRNAAAQRAHRKRQKEQAMG